MPKGIHKNPQTPSRRGFAAMTPEKRREIARKGGAAVPASKRSFAMDRDLAASAGAEGGRNSNRYSKRTHKEPAT